MKCLRCGAGNEWIEGNVRASQSDQVEVLSQQLTEVKAERDALQKLLIDKIIERAIPYPTKEEHD